MGQRYRQRHAQHHVGQAQTKLYAKQRRQAQRHDFLPPPPQPGGQQDKQRRRHHRPKAVGDMDGHARLVTQHPVLVIVGRRREQVEGRFGMQAAPPIPLAHRQLGAGKGSVVGGGPTPKGDLPHHHQGGDNRQPTQIKRRTGTSRGRAQAQGQPPQERQGGHAAQQMPRYHQRPQVQGDCQHPQGGLEQQQAQQRHHPRALSLEAPEGQRRQQADAKGQSTGKIAVHHLVPGFVQLNLGAGKGLLGMGQVLVSVGRHQGAITTGPVRAAKASVGQPGVGA
ncbi:hypothetical protein EDC28_111125 [Gallaecimonas pentaromativorans]|uniref:Uncharacterized protein n=1 Tax=Gallaecimonas pentaromativorans TaxID=584787 RepID=A0A3N1P0V3_9GAMM|nr:hypothetical protein EDC28_111125 [Gallaecimonas pentaromativorans]